jgi:hypothetical protein
LDFWPYFTGFVNSITAQLDNTDTAKTAKSFNNFVLACGRAVLNGFASSIPRLMLALVRRTANVFAIHRAA